MIVVWRVTEQCNLSCPFCGYDRRVQRRRRNADVDAMMRFGAVLADYQRATDDRVLVSWLGGEPLLWPRLHELTEHFTRQLGLSISATTNGTSLGSAVVRQHVIDHYAELTVSVDGIGAVHDDLRGWHGGFAHLSRAIPSLVAERRARGRGPRVRVNVVLMRDTIGGFEALCEELARWGIDEITFNQLGGQDRPEFLPAHRLLSRDVEWLCANIPRIRDELAARGVRLSGGPGYLQRLVASASGQHISIDDCGPGEQFLFIDELARVAPCSFAVDEYGIPLHEIDTWRALAQVPREFALRRAASRAAACNDCHSTHVFEKFQTVVIPSGAPKPRSRGITTIPKEGVVILSPWNSLRVNSAKDPQGSGRALYREIEDPSPDGSG
jgi:MoaA/NifB/PqqE/SkfB family radical SAM enzyme